MKEIFCALAIGFFGCSTVTAFAESGGQELVLAKEGQPTAMIVTATKPTRAAQLAAYELQNHIKQITQAQLPIVTDGEDTPGMTRILVGESTATRELGLSNEEFGEQEYLIRFLPNTLVLMGRDKEDRGKVIYDYLADPHAVETWPGLYDAQGTMYAVYDFLEKFCDVRWINPTDFGTIIPQEPTLSVRGEELRRRPAMLFRGGSAAQDATRYNDAGGLWREDSEEGETYKALAYQKIYATYPNAIRRHLPLRGQNQLFQHRMKAGGDQRQCNHSFYPYYERFLEKNHPHFESYHPEYFAQGYQGKEPPQLCYSHPATIAQVVADVRDYFDHGGYRKLYKTIAAPGYKWGEDFFALEPMDNANFCQCETCKAQYKSDQVARYTWTKARLAPNASKERPGYREQAGRHSAYWFRFVNAVAKELRKSHPDKFISTLAYMTHEVPPDFALEPNVVVQFAPSANRMGAAGADLLKSQMHLLQEWHDKHPKTPLYVWLYNTFPKEIADNGRFYCFPGAFAHEAKQQFDAFNRLGIEGIYHCGFNGEVENYITYKLMDDPTRNVDELLAEYFSAYDAAEKPIRQFYEILENRYADPSLLPIMADGKPYQGHQTMELAWAHLGNAATMEKLETLMEEAGRNAKGNAATLVKLWDLSTWKYMKEGRKQFVARTSAPIPTATAVRVPPAQGDPEKVDWKQVTRLPDTWSQRGSDNPSERQYHARICHDGEFFYLELVEENIASEQLISSAGISPYDCWEPLFARQRAQPFRQYFIGPTGQTNAMSHGEINWRQDVEMEETGIRGVSHTDEGRWISRISWPLVSLTDQPLKPGDTVFMNLIRVSNPELTKGDGLGIDSWIPFCTVKEVDRLAEVRLAP